MLNPRREMQCWCDQPIHADQYGIDGDPEEALSKKQQIHQDLRLVDELKNFQQNLGFPIVSGLGFGAQGLGFRAPWRFTDLGLH